MSAHRSKCRCCGVDVAGIFAKFRVCSVCTICNDSHGHELHHRLLRDFQSGVAHPWLVVAVSALDDAWLTGHMRVTPPDGLACIDVAPKRWEVVLAWARHEKRSASAQMVIEAVLSPYRGLPNVQSVRDRITVDMKAAMHAWDPKLVDVEVKAGPHATINDEIVLNIQATAPIGEVAIKGGEHVEIPGDIYSRPRGSA